ncbi:MAG: UDP-N-acetylmuramoyl-L-alanyl-D-glutamate--2,6-diaminopimelate ligase [Oscillospiraceae bacterium]|nr:UDP-N-acetylmuramoyl-L-alanyl-D-glutamate--2,6-diaminopimelate ligase [Oscillospiraceae bacterium]
MKLAQIIENLTVVQAKACENIEITGITCDSRKVEEGSIFVAIKGYETDGHRYIASAAEKGAACVICQEEPQTDIPYIIVEDSRKALSLAAAEFYGRPADNMKIIGVTGTNGKTTVTNLLKTVLEKAAGAKVGLIGTNGNMIGDEFIETERTTPEGDQLQELFAKMRDAGCTHVVMEVSSHALYLGRVEGVKFAAAVFTNLTQDHLDFHRTMEEYFDAKALLFEKCEKAVINIDDEWGRKLAEKVSCEKITYSSKDNSADYVAKNVKLLPDRVEFEALTLGGINRACVPIPGGFTVYNGLAAISCLCALGMELETVCAALKTAHGVKGRMEVVPGPENCTVIIDYAHTPDALENVLRSLKGFAKGRVVCLFGCGGDRDKTKRPLMAEISVNLADFVIFTSDNPRTEEPMDIINDILAGAKGSKKPHKVICDRREAIRFAVENAMEDDVILLAGKGHETYQIIGKTKTHLDEREEVAKVLADMKK